MNKESVVEIAEQRRRSLLDEEAGEEFYGREPAARNHLSAEKLRKNYEAFMGETADMVADLEEVLRVAGHGTHPSTPYMIEALRARVERMSGMIESTVCNMALELGDPF